jgi:hypothetical protein
MAQIVGGLPDVSLPSESASAADLDDILNVADACYVPLGQQASRWRGSDEFARIAQRFGRNDLCFGMGGPEGLTLETPAGSSSALVRLLPDEKHPALGSGLLATLQLPFLQDEEEAMDTCMWLNYFQAIQWSDAPQLGTWGPRQLGDAFTPGTSSFYPNALYRDGVATNAALWQVAHARWAKEQFWPDLQDLTMREVFERRGALGTGC